MQATETCFSTCSRPKRARWSLTPSQMQIKGLISKSLITKRKVIVGASSERKEARNLVAEDSATGGKTCVCIVLKKGCF